MALSIFFLLFLTGANASDSNVYPIAEVADGGVVNVRRQPDATSPVIGRLRTGDSFAAQPGSEFFAILDGPYAGGHISAKFVKLTGEKYTLGKSIADEVRIRAYPSRNGRIIASINKNAYMAIEQKEEWYEIKDGPFRGRFVSAQFVRPIDETASAPTAATPMVATVAPGAKADDTAKDAAEVKDIATSAEKTSSDKTQSLTADASTTSTNTQEVAATPNLSSDSKPTTMSAPSTSQPMTSTQAPPTTSALTATPSAVPSTSSPQSSTPLATQTVKSSANQGAPNTPNTQVEAPKRQALQVPTDEVAQWDEKTEQRFFEKVQKLFKPKAGDVQVPMPVYYEESTSPIMDLNTRVRNNEPLEIERTAFIDILHKLVIKDWFKKPEIEKILKDDSSDPSWLSVAKFEGSGIRVVYIEQKLEVRVYVPPELRAPGVASITKSQQTLGQEFEEPPFFSSFINIHANQTIDTRNTGFADRRSPLRAQFESGTKIASLILEANGSYVEDRGTLAPGVSPFSREDVRLVRDFPSILARASVGDLIYPVQAFQVYRSMQGVAISSQFSMSPSKLTYPTGAYEIFLKNNSKVYVWVNDQLQQVLDLPAGRHEIKDFPYTNGANNIRLEIVDEFGRTETMDYSYFSNTELLKPGLHQFNYAAGYPATIPTNGQRQYDEENATYSMFHRYGFNNYFTGGINVQGDNEQLIAGIDGLWSTKIGYFKIEPAYSQSSAAGTGFAVATRYSYVDYKGPEKTQRSFNTTLTYRSKSFAQLGNLETVGSTRRYDLSASFTRGLSKRLSLFLGGNYRVNEDTTNNLGNSFSLSAGVNSRWANGVSLNLTASHAHSPNGKDNIGFMAFFLWSFPKEKQVITGIANTADSSSRLGWSYNPSSGADTASYTAAIRDSSTERGYGGQINFNGNRARITLNHEVIQTKDDNPTTTTVESDTAANVTTLQLGTALVFAGGRFGIGRPVTDSFAIFSPVKSLRGQELRVNPDSNENYIARSTWLGPAVVSEVGSYTPTTFKIGGKDLPVGLSIPQDHFHLYPGYKNGYGFALGTDANVYLMATLLAPDGQPMGMVAGYARYLDDEKTPPVTIFTSRTGKIRSEGFKAGRYRLEIQTDKFEPIEFTVPESAEEEYDIGILRLKEK